MTGDPKNLLSTLLNISRIDIALARIVSERKRLDKEIGDANVALKKARVERAERTKVLEERKSHYSKEEKRIKEERMKLAERRKALTTLGAYKLQQAAEREIDHSSRQLSSQEELAIGVLDEMEKHEQLVQASEEKVQKLQSQIDALSQEAEAALAAFEERSARQNGERKQLAQLVDSKTLTAYERVKERFIMDPIVPVIKGNCSGCHMQVGPQVHVQVSRGDSLVRCLGCGRILYADESASVEAPKE